MLLCFSGGVGGAKLASGLSALRGAELTVVVNTGDDFEHLGLHIAPDIDTVTYTLASLNNRTTGWGLEGETWQFMASLHRLGGPNWFKLGDSDLATHILRTLRLRGGESLSVVTSSFAERLGIASRIVPMSDDPVRTHVVTSEGTLGFQEYFVGRQCAPSVQSIFFDGSETARLSAGLEETLTSSELEAIVFGPSNPFLSVDPILSLADVKARLKAAAVPVVAVSPIVGGRAIKGPAGKIMAELGLDVSPVTVAKHYWEFISGFVLDRQDAADANKIQEMGLEVLITDTVMTSADAEQRLAEDVQRFAASIAANTRRTARP